MALEMKYFVLKPHAREVPSPHAKASIEAMRRYARIIEEHDPELAIQLFIWAEKEREHYNSLLLPD